MLRLILLFRVRVPGLACFMAAYTRQTLWISAALGGKAYHRAPARAHFAHSSSSV
jgi:hypothetical protein